MKGTETNVPPCAMCGKPRGGFMRSDGWGHYYDCCSDKCGESLKGSHRWWELELAQALEREQELLGGLKYIDERIRECRARVEAGTEKNR